MGAYAAYLRTTALLRAIFAKIARYIARLCNPGQSTMLGEESNTPVAKGQKSYSTAGRIDLQQVIPTREMCFA
jgi:hypothetical protein